MLHIVFCKFADFVFCFRLPTVQEMAQKEAAAQLRYTTRVGLEAGWRPIDPDKDTFLMRPVPRELV